MPSPITEAVNYQELKRKLLAGKFLAGRRLVIECNNVNTISYRDFYELYLSLSFAEDWQWLDAGGNISLRQSIGKTLCHLWSDLLQWPFIYISQSRTTARLLREVDSQTFNRAGRSILFLRTDHWFNIQSGGSVGHIQGVIEGLRNWGYGITVVSTDYLANIPVDEHFQLYTPVYRAGRNIPNIPELLYNQQLVSFIETKWREWSPAVIYQRYSLGNYAGVWLKRKHHIPLICEYNGSFPWMARHWEGRKLFHEKLLSRIEALNLQAADIIVVVSRALQDELTGRGIPVNKILVNPNGVDPERYSPKVDGSMIRRQFRLDGKIVIGFIGTFGKWHGVEVLAGAFGQLIQQEPDLRRKVRLLLIGDGPTMPLVHAQLQKYNIADVCILTGKIPQDSGPSYLAACDVLVSPQVPNPDGTQFFGSPTKLFEYMAMGKGIVASALGQINEILRHNETAWLVKPGDIGCLASGLKTVIADPSLNDRLGKAARREVLQKYTWKEHTRKIIAKLEDLKNE